MLIPGVVGAVLFDLLEGDPKARPTAEDGYAACQAASAEPAIGVVGAGTGATVAKAGDPSRRAPGGLGIASARAGAALVSAVMVANSVGGIWDDERQEWIAPLSRWDPDGDLLPGANTTIGVIATDAKLTKEQANRVATVAHDGIARAVRPAHTMYDGDTMFCIATGAAAAAYDAIRGRGYGGGGARDRSGRAARRCALTLGQRDAGAACRRQLSKRSLVDPV